MSSADDERWDHAISTLTDAYCTANGQTTRDVFELILQHKEDVCQYPQMLVFNCVLSAITKRTGRNPNLDTTLTIQVDTILSVHRDDGGELSIMEEPESEPDDSSSQPQTAWASKVTLDSGVVPICCRACTDGGRQVLVIGMVGCKCLTVLNLGTGNTETTINLPLPVLLATPSALNEPSSRMYVVMDGGQTPFVEVDITMGSFLPVIDASTEEPCVGPLGLLPSDDGKTLTLTWAVDPKMTYAVVTVRGKPALEVQVP